MSYRFKLDAVERKLVKGKLWIVEPGRIREHQPDPYADEENQESNK